MATTSSILANVNWLVPSEPAFVGVIPKMSKASRIASISIRMMSVLVVLFSNDSTGISSASKPSIIALLIRRFKMSEFSLNDCNIATLNAFSLTVISFTYMDSSLLDNTNSASII